MENEEKKKKKSGGKTIGIIILVVIALLIVFYYWGWPMVQKMIVQRTCNKWGEEYKATRGYYRWACVNSKGMAVDPETGEKYEYRILENDPSGNAVKPIIYLYPEEKTEITVTLGKPSNITASYPKYVNGWNVVANPDGTLIDTKTNRSLYALYWEGLNDVNFEKDDGFVVKGEDSIDFLEEKLKVLGLNERESEEFIVYWLPILEKNEYNYIRFATTDEINENMPLNLSVKPDTIIRVMMAHKKLDNYIEVNEQKLVTPERKGFTVVEWGGTNLNNNISK